MAIAAKLFLGVQPENIIVVTEKRDDGSIWQLCALAEDDLKKLVPYAKDNAAFQQVMRMPQKRYGGDPVVSPPVPPYVPAAADGQHRYKGASGHG